MSFIECPPMLTTPRLPAPWQGCTPVPLPLSTIFPALRPGSRAREYQRLIESWREKRARERDERLRAEIAAKPIAPTATVVRALASRLGSASALADRVGVPVYLVRCWTRGAATPQREAKRQLALLAQFYGIEEDLR